MERVSLSLSLAACTPFGNNLVNNFLELVGKIPLFVLGFKLRKKQGSFKAKGPACLHCTLCFIK